MLTRSRLTVPHHQLVLKISVPDVTPGRTATQHMHVDKKLEHRGSVYPQCRDIQPLHIITGCSMVHVRRLYPLCTYSNSLCIRNSLRHQTTQTTQPNMRKRKGFVKYYQSVFREFANDSMAMEAKFKARTRKLLL